MQVGRGDSLGAVWALTGGVHDTSALAIRDSELVRMSKASPLSVLGLIDEAWTHQDGMHLSSCTPCLVVLPLCGNKAEPDHHWEH